MPAPLPRRLHPLHQGPPVGELHTNGSRTSLPGGDRLLQAADGVGHRAARGEDAALHRLLGKRHAVRHQEVVHRGGRLAAFRNRPHDERLPAAAVACRKHPLHATTRVSAPPLATPAGKCSLPDTSRGSVHGRPHRCAEPRMCDRPPGRHARIRCRTRASRAHAIMPSCEGIHRPLCCASYATPTPADLRGSRVIEVCGRGRREHWPQLSCFHAGHTTGARAAQVAGIRGDRGEGGGRLTGTVVS